jgi:hypothetical protein
MVGKNTKNASNFETSKTTHNEITKASQIKQPIKKEPPQPSET